MRVALELFVVGLAVAFALTPLPPALVEGWFSTRVYPIVQGLLTPLSNLVPFAILDLLIAGALVSVLVALVRAVRAVRRDRSLKPVVLLSRRLLVAAAVVYLVFLGLW